jgi:exodeoxyribonuclease VII large subunit
MMLDDRYLSVQDVMRMLNDMLEVEYPQILFTGEISQLTTAQSGHTYFTVKDERAQVSCALWAGVGRSLKCRPKVGMTVKCRGRPSLYGQTGRFQIIVSHIVEEGEGELQRRFLELKAKLEHEGLFARERKRPLPFLPRGIGIVTSRTGAVIHDMMVKVHERFPSVPVYLSDTRVQGDGIAKEIAQAIRRLDATDLIDVIIVARGGGSLEDLWQFNEEEVVRAVFACSKPVVSGVGHEVDITLCDLVADVRAPTPTAAAEMVVPLQTELLHRVAELERRLVDVDRWFQPIVQLVDDLGGRLQGRFRSVCKEYRLRVQAAVSSLANIKPRAVMQLLNAKLIGLERELSVATRRNIADRQRIVEVNQARLNQSFGAEELHVVARSIQSIEDRLRRGIKQRYEIKLEALRGVQGRLDAISPRAVLNRGYSLVSKGGSYVSSAKMISRGDSIAITMKDGTFNANVGEGCHMSKEEHD